MRKDRSELWKYLEAHKTRAMLPLPAELRQLFGEPDDIQESENTLNPSVWGVTDDVPWYARYTEEEKRLDQIGYVDWVYHLPTASRSINVVLRKDGASVLGWMWFEDVPEGEEQGPPA